MHFNSTSRNALFYEPTVCTLQFLDYIIILRKVAFPDAARVCNVIPFKFCITLALFFIFFYPFVYFFAPISGTMTYRNLISNNSLQTTYPFQNPQRTCRRGLEIAEIKERLRCRLWHHPRDGIHPNIKLLLYTYYYIVCKSLVRNWI